MRTHVVFLHQNGDGDVSTAQECDRQITVKEGLDSRAAVDSDSDNSSRFLKFLLRGRCGACCSRLSERIDSARTRYTMNADDADECAT